LPVPGKDDANFIFTVVLKKWFYYHIKTLIKGPDC
jgi:hypothetical protein